MPSPNPISLPDAPVLVVGLTHAAWLAPDGEAEDLTATEAAARLGDNTPPLLCHAPATARRLGVDPFPAFDLLELFAFVRPAGFCVPTPRGLAEQLALDPPHNLADAALALRRAALRLLAELGEESAARGARQAAAAMTQGGWLWGAPRLG